MVTIFSRLVRNVEIFLVRASNSFLSRCSPRFCVKRRGNSHHARRSTPRETYLLCVKSLSLVRRRVQCGQELGQRWVVGSHRAFAGGTGEGGRTKAWASGARPFKASKQIAMSRAQQRIE